MSEPTKTLVPKLRFLEFKDAREWEEKRLEEIKAQINTIDRESEAGKKLRVLLEQMDTRLDEIDAQVEAIKKARNGTYPV